MKEEKLYETGCGGYLLKPDGRFFRLTREGVKAYKKEQEEKKEPKEVNYKKGLLF